MFTQFSLRHSSHIPVSATEPAVHSGQISPPPHLARKALKLGTHGNEKCCEALKWCSCETADNAKRMRGAGTRNFQEATLGAVK